MDFAVLADERVNIKKKRKESNKYWNLASELKKKKQWVMKVTVIPIVFETFSKNLMKELDEFEIGSLAYITHISKYLKAL